jgi:hypothetical protein
MPIVASTAIVMTASGNGAIGKLDDEGSTIGMCRIPWARIEEPDVSTLPRFRLDNWEVMVSNPGGEIEGACRA